MPESDHSITCSRPWVGFLFLAAALLTQGCFRAPPVIEQPPTLLTRGELTCLRSLDRLLELEARHGEEIWPGFSILETPLLIHRPEGGRSFLVGAGIQEGEAVHRRDLPNLPAVYAVPAELLALNPGVAFRRDVEVLGVKAFMIRNLDRDKEEEWSPLLVHELFHQYQLLHFQDRSPAGDLCRYPYEDFLNAAAMMEEQEFLSRAATLKPGRDASEAFHTYLEARRARYLSGDRDMAARIENWEERLEGTARYVEDMYSLFAGFREGSKVIHEILGSLKSLQPTALQKWRYYRSGEAILMILTALHPNAAWRFQIEDQDSPFQAALQLEGLENASAPQVGAQVPGSRLEDRARPLLESYLATEKKLLESWSSQGPRLITLTLPVTSSSHYSSMGMTFLLEDCSRFISRVRLFVDQAAGLVVENRSVRLDFGPNARGSYLIQFYGEFDPATLPQARCTLDAGSGCRFDKGLVLQGPGWSLRAGQGGNLLLEPEGLSVELLAP